MKAPRFAGGVFFYCQFTDCLVDPNLQTWFSTFAGKGNLDKS